MSLSPLTAQISALLASPLHAALPLPLPRLARVPHPVARLPPRLPALHPHRPLAVQALLHTVGAAVDGLSRGVTIASIAGMLEASGKFHPQGHDVSAWTYTLLSTCAIASGGFLVSLFSLHEASYRLSVPSVFRSGVGVCGTMDVWAAALAGLGYWVMVSVRLMDGLAARTVCVLFLGGILILRAVRTQLVSTSSKNR